MAISNNAVKEIQSLTVDLGELIHAINPITDKEWDAFEKLVGAHKNLMKIDTGALLQMELPFESKTLTKQASKTDCPRCSGSGLWRDPTGSSHEPQECNCKNIRVDLWPNTKAEWQEEIASAEV